MAILLIETPDATQALEFWGSTTGTITYDSTLATKSGLASWKCDSASNATARLRTGTLVNPARAVAYYQFTDLPTSTTSILGIFNGSQTVQLKITSGGVLQLFDNAGSQVGSNGSTLSTGIWHRICLVLDRGASTQDGKVFLDGNEDISATSIDDGTGSFDEVIFGWFGAAGTNKVVNVQHAYVDDVTDLTDPGDVRVTAKLPTNSGGTNGWDGEQASGAEVNDRPIDETTGHLHAGSDDQVESSDIQAVGAGDVDITGETILGHTGWVWADRTSGGGGSPSILVNDAETAIALAVGAPDIFVDVNTSAGYPSGGTDEIGMHSTNGSADTNWYEGGIMIAYIASAIARRRVGVAGAGRAMMM